MARKTKEEAEKTRLAILDAALELIYQKGYAATNLQDIAEHLGATRGAVYWHFKNKQDLLFKLAESIDETIDHQLNQKALEVRNLDDLKEFFLFYISLFQKNERYHKYLTIVMTRIEWSDELSEVITSFKRQTQELVAFSLSLLKKAEKGGEMQEGLNKQWVSKAMVAVVESLLSGLCPPFGSRDLKLAKVSLEVFFSGIRK